MEDSGRSGMVVASRAYIVVVGLLDVGFFLSGLHIFGL